MTLRRRAVGEACDLALTGADIDHPLRAFEALGREREDLLLVLGIDAVGEPVLPPPGVLLPRVAIDVGRSRSHAAG